MLYMIEINGFKFYDEPGSCGSCPVFSNGATHMSPGAKIGHCLIFDEWHHSWCNVPPRCRKLFKKAMTYPEGTKLAIVKNEK